MITFKKAHSTAKYESRGSISLLKLPSRTEAALIRSNITTIEKLVKAKRKRLLRVKSIGPKTAKFLMRLKKDISSTKGVEDKNITKNRFYENDPIEVIGFPLRLENSLKINGIRTVGQLFRAQREQLLHIRNMGLKSVQVIEKLKENTSLNFGAKAESSLSVNLSPTELLESMLSRFPDERTKNVIERRYGLVNGEKETLEEIGSTYGITRERVRQIQSRFIKRLAHPSNGFRNSLILVLEDLIISYGGLINEDEADLYAPDIFKKRILDGSSLLDFFSDLNMIQRIQISETAFYSIRIKNLKLDQLMDDIIILLKKSKSFLTPRQIAFILEQKIKFNETQLTLNSLVEKICELDPRIERKYGAYFGPYITSNHIHDLWIPLITIVLEQEGHPLHFTEISDKVNERLTESNRKLDVRRAHSILISSPEFAHSGIKGMYGLTTWGLRKESTIELSIEAIRIAGFPLHIDQIYNYVSRYKDSPKGNIKSILESSGRFNRKGEGIYEIKQN